jgi:hypothetical protein
MSCGHALGAFLTTSIAKKNLARKTAMPTNAPGAAGGSGDVVEVKAAPGPSRKGKKGARKTKRDPLEEIEDEVLQLMEMENGFQTVAMDLLRKANELHEWRETKYGVD